MSSHHERRITGSLPTFELSSYQAATGSSHHERVVIDPMLQFRLAPELTYVMLSESRPTALCYVNYDHTGVGGRSTPGDKVWLRYDSFTDRLFYTTSPFGLTARPLKESEVEEYFAKLKKRSERQDDQEAGKTRSSGSQSTAVKLEPISTAKFIYREGWHGKLMHLQLPSVYRATEPSDGIERTYLGDCSLYLMSAEELEKHALPSKSGEDGHLNADFEAALIARLAGVSRDKGGNDIRGSTVPGSDLRTYQISNYLCATIDHSIDQVCDIGFDIHRYAAESGNQVDFPAGTMLWLHHRRPSQDEDDIESGSKDAESWSSRDQIIESKLGYGLRPRSHRTNVLLRQETRSAYGREDSDISAMCTKDSLGGTLRMGIHKDLPLGGYDVPSGMSWYTLQVTDGAEPALVHKHNGQSRYQAAQLPWLMMQDETGVSVGYVIECSPTPEVCIARLMGDEPFCKSSALASQSKEDAESSRLFFQAITEEANEWTRH